MNMDAAIQKSQNDEAERKLKQNSDLKDLRHQQKEATAIREVQKIALKKIVDFQLKVGAHFFNVFNQSEVGLSFN